MDDNEHDEQYWLARRHRALYFASVMATARLSRNRALVEGDFFACLYYHEKYVNSKAEFEAIISEFP